MRHIAPLGSLVLVLCGVFSGWSAEPISALSLPTLEEAARFRAEGPAGIDRLIELRKQIEAAQQQATEKYSSDPQDSYVTTIRECMDLVTRLAPVIDAAAGAKFSHQSGLYWYTDKAAALEAAKKSGKPLLSLRMLGKLNEDLSCANSRFFRTVLYPNEKISQLLHEKYILLWESVRPAPVITIDFGDGRKIVRTITGNSIHYVLLPDGTVVDALPGMYGPSAFLKRLSETSEVAAKAIATENVQERAQILDRHTTAVCKSIDENWEADIARVPETLGTQISHFPASVGAVPPGVDEVSFWQAMGRLHPEDAKLDEKAREIVVSMRAPAVAAGRRAMGKSLAEMPGMRMVRNLEGSMLADTARNEYQFRRQIHRWMQDNPGFRKQLDVLNEQVYATLFLTPSTDPWLGLSLPDVYSALPNGGVVVPEPPVEGQQQQQQAAVKTQGDVLNGAIEALNSLLRTP